MLLSFPVVKLWARFVPRVQLFGVSLNPGPFTIKEHVCITVMANIVSSGVYANDVIASQKFFYEQEVSYAYQVGGRASFSSFLLPYQPLVSTASPSAPNSSASPLAASSAPSSSGPPL